MRDHDPCATERRRRRRAVAWATPLLLSLLTFLTTTANAQVPISSSPDITLRLGGASLIVSDENVVVDNQLGILALENLGPLPASAEVIALGEAFGGDRLVAFETTTSLPGGVVARPGDVVRTDGASYSIEFDASAAGVPRGVATDALSQVADGLILSFDTTVNLAGLVAADEDLVLWDGNAFSMALDGSEAGVLASLDLDGATALGGDRFLVSFDVSGRIDGLDFSDEDILRYDGASWDLWYDASAADPDWGAADLDAIQVPEPGLLGALAAGFGLLVRLRRRPRR